MNSKRAENPNPITIDHRRIEAILAVQQAITDAVDPTPWPRPGAVVLGAPWAA